MIKSRRRSKIFFAPVLASRLLGDEILASAGEIFQAAYGIAEATAGVCRAAEAAAGVKFRVVHAGDYFQQVCQMPSFFCGGTGCRSRTRGGVTACLSYVLLTRYVHHPGHNATWR